jgi:hypothetical protein
MTIKCKCGGKFVRTDIEAVYSAEYKRTLYRDTDSEKANWKCNGCGLVRTQRKRQPASK